jgi:thiamine-phosphate pyrophosphorylase
MTAQIIDANINRVSEGLRVIEDYVRFIAKHKPITDQLATLRKKINRTETETTKIAHLRARQTGTDMREKEPPPVRLSIQETLIANFKRVEEGLRTLEEYTGNALYNNARYDVYMLEKEVVLLAEKPVIKKGIYLISDDPAILKQGMQWGCALVQLRDKTATKEQIYNKALTIKEMALLFDVPWLINDYLDIALLTDANGLHTGQDDLPVPTLRHLMGDHKLLGRTTHTHEQGIIAQEGGADYVSVGPIWETPSKPNRAGIGFDYLNQASQLEIPYVAIGGINRSNISEIMGYHPPMVGVIRDYKNIPEWNKNYFSP